jgi:pentose-5-phosphate-3-epimerase
VSFTQQNKILTISKIKVSLNDDGLFTVEGQKKVVHAGPDIVIIGTIIFWWDQYPADIVLVA